MDIQDWENSIIVKGTKQEFTVLPPVMQFATQEHFIDINQLNLKADLSTYLKKDKYPLPASADREGYFDERHYDYWLSGLQHYLKITAICDRNGLALDGNSKVLDFGCASGRVLRHFAIQNETPAWGCDINENHVVWCNKHLSDKAIVFLNTSLPYLQIEDSFFDLVHCASVFTHIENFETSWLSEMKRILKPGGIAYITIHDETSWKNMPQEWGVGRAVVSHPKFEKQWLEKGFPGEKFVSRWHMDRSYSSNVFYKLDYIKRVWGKFFHISEIIPMGSGYQTVLVLKKQQ